MFYSFRDALQKFRKEFGLQRKHIRLVDLYKGAAHMLDEIQEMIWNALIKENGETVARLFTNFYGNQLLDEEFFEFLQQEDII